MKVFKIVYSLQKQNILSIFNEKFQEKYKFYFDYDNKIFSLTKNIKISNKSIQKIKIKL